MHILYTVEIDGESKQFRWRCRDNFSSFRFRILRKTTAFRSPTRPQHLETEEQWSQFWHSLPRVTPNLVRLDVDLFASIESLIIPEADRTALPSSVGTLRVTITPRPSKASVI